MKKLIPVFLCFLALCGCWNYQDTNRRLIVAGAAMDLGENGETLISVETVSFNDTENKPESRLISGRGSGVSDAIDDILKKTGKKLYWQHAVVMVLGARYAQNGIEQLLDYILNNHELRITLNLAVSGLENASGVFGLETGGNIVSYSAASVLEESDRLGYCVKEYAYDTLNIYTDNLRDFALPLIISGENGALAASGCAAFRGDKMMGTINSVESQYLHLVRGSLDSMALHIDTENIKSSVVISSPKAKISIRPENGAINAQVEMKAEYEVLMSVEQPPMDRQERMELIKHEAENQLAEGMIKTNEHFELMGCDLFGWGERVFRHYPRDYEIMSGNGAFQARKNVSFISSLRSQIESAAGQTIRSEGG